MDCQKGSYMSDVQIPGAGTDQIADKDATEPTQKVDGMSRADFEAMLAAKIDENNRKWQSKFDTVLTEKKTVEGKALTVEQRMEQLEREREAERLGFAREKAKLGAKIDDELDGAIRLYGSSKADEITSGAEAIRAYFEKLNAAHEEDKAKAVKEALAKVGAQLPPKAGKDQKVLQLSEFNKLSPKDRASYMASGGVVVD